VNNVGTTGYFDPYDADFAADPYSYYEEMRRRCPVTHSPLHGGFWAVTRYEDVRHAALHPEVFSSRYVSIPKDYGLGDTAEMPLLPLTLDPPAHTRIKLLLTPAFLPARAAEFETAIRRNVIALLEPLVARGRFDASGEFAALVATGTIAEILGLSESVAKLADWVRRVTEQTVSDPDDAKQAGMEAFLFLYEALNQRKEQPGADVLSYLWQTEIDGDRLSDFEVVQAAIVLFFAGIETTWSTLASAIWHLARTPEHQDLLRAHPELIPTAREEFLRAFTPVSPARQVTRDVELAGQELRAGDMVLLSTASANRDEDEFPDPATLQLDRNPNRHVAFGVGIHRCLGVNVARLELKVALEELLRLVPPFRLADPSGVEWTAGNQRGARNVQIVFPDPLNGSSVAP
jgi:hypothetical protein